jgi:hypothetical protein
VLAQIASTDPISHCINAFGASRMIALSNNTVSKTAAANTVVGTMSLLDSTGTARTANWSLTPNAANYFLTAGNNLETARASIPAGLYSVHVRANAQFVDLKQKAWFVIQVS